MSDRHLRLGTRGSALAVAQSQWVAEALRRRVPDVEIELVRIKTSGDRITDRPLFDVGGKGLFVKEIEEALLDRRIDVAVHSMKDLPAVLAPALVIGAVPAREDPRDVLVSTSRGGIASLPSGARVATGSLRRQAFLRHARPDVEVVPIRGNVDTRLARWRSGEVLGLVLASAGLRRLGIELDEAEPIEPAAMLPAIGQGALAIEIHEASGWRSVVETLNDPVAAAATTAERAVLRALGGDCTTPVAAHGEARDGRLRLAAAVADATGSRLVRRERAGAIADADALGRALGEELLASGAREILEELRR
jgi:hydroxymethylbilane synthase